LFLTTKSRKEPEEEKGRKKKKRKEGKETEKQTASEVAERKRERARRDSWADAKGKTVVPRRRSGRDRSQLLRHALMTSHALREAEGKNAAHESAPARPQRSGGRMKPTKAVQARTHRGYRETESARQRARRSRRRQHPAPRPKPAPPRFGRSPSLAPDFPRDSGAP